MAAGLHVAFQKKAGKPDAWPQRRLAAGRGGCVFPVGWRRSVFFPLLLHVILVLVPENETGRVVSRLQTGVIFDNLLNSVSIGVGLVLFCFRGFF